MAPSFQVFYDDLEQKYNKIKSLKEEFKDLQSEFGIKKPSSIPRIVPRVAFLNKKSVNLLESKPENETSSKPEDIKKTPQYNKYQRPTSVISGEY